MGVEHRGSPRHAVAFDCTLTRPHGNPVRGRTEDLGAGGMRVVTDRPLTIDEELGFELLLDATGPVDGRARVVRQQGPNCYALRFEAAAADIVDWVSRTT